MVRIEGGNLGAARVRRNHGKGGKDMVAAKICRVGGVGRSVGFMRAARMAIVAVCLLDWRRRGGA